MKRTLWPTPDELATATPHQREKYALATAGAVGILGGNPGAGKTFTTGQIIKCVIEKYGPQEVRVCAPTGKAAQRITEVMADYRIVGVEATTIHRLLGVSRNGHDQKGWGFMRNRGNPLPNRFLFVDECSMCDCDITASLLDACQPGTHILFIGDFAQLPPVGHGAPLRDMIAAGIPYGELTEIHRNEGDVVRACRDMKEGRPAMPSPRIDLAAGHNWSHIEAARPTWQLNTLARLLRNVPSQYDPMWDVQVLCATNDSSEVGRKRLNPMIQEILNPDGYRLDGGRFRVGDKVICLTNCNDGLPLAECGDCMVAAQHDKGFFVCTDCGKAWKPMEGTLDFVANGEIGKVVSIEPGMMLVEIETPKRTVGVMGEWLKEFDLAYAITVHKSQGSQWKVPILMIDDSRGADMVTSWEWHRTGFSRMQSLLFTIGKLATIHRQCKKSALASRKTFLPEEISMRQATRIVGVAA